MKRIIYLVAILSVIACLVISVVKNHLFVAGGWGAMLVFMVLFPLK